MSDTVWRWRVMSRSRSRAIHRRRWPVDLAERKPARLIFDLVVTSGSDMMQDGRDVRRVVNDRLPPS
jgi:hypothetical protein